MPKPAVFAILLGLAFSSTALAQEDATVCDSLGMDTLQAQIDREGDQTRKMAAMEHQKLALAAMERKQLDECAVHLGRAREALGAKP